MELHIYVPTNPGEYHAIVLSKRGDIAAHVSLSDGHELNWRASVFETATNKEFPANDDWARAMLTLMSIESELLRTIDVNSIIDDVCSRESSKAQYVT